MTLRWISFERKAWLRIRTELLASERLWQDFKLARRARRQRRGVRSWLLRFWLLIFIPVMVISNLRGGRGSSEFVVALLWLFATGASFHWAGQLSGTLYFSSGLRTLSHLPVGDNDLFWALWRSFLAGTRWLALGSAVGYALLAFGLGAGWNSLFMGAALGALQWGVIVATANCLFAYGPRRAFSSLTSLCFVGVAGVMIFGPTQPALLSWVAELGYWLPPTNCMFYLIGLSPGSSFVDNLVFCLLAAVVLATFPFALRKARREFALTEDVFMEARRATVATEMVSPRWPEFTIEFAQPRTETEAKIASRESLAHYDWRAAGLVERIVACVLNPRERTLAEFLLAAQTQWTSALRNLFLTVLFLLLPAWYFAPQLRASADFVVFLAASFLLALSAGNWRAMKPISSNGLQPPFHAFYPVGFAELMRTILKINVCRYVLSVLILTVPLVFCAGVLQLGVALTLSLAGKLFLLGLFAQPIIAIASISSVSNDSNNFSFALCAVLFLLLLAAAVAGFLFSTNVRLMAVCASFAVGLPVAGLLLYGRHFNQSRFDLIPASRRDGS